MANELLSLFGFSEYSPEVKNLLGKFGIPAKPELQAGEKIYSNKKQGIELTFMSRYNFLDYYGQTGKMYTDDSAESFLNAMTFGDYTGKKAYPYPMPFSLAFDDSPETVIHKVQAKASENAETTYGSYQYFKLDEYYLTIGFNKNKELIFVYLILVTKQEKMARGLKKLIGKQNKNISTAKRSQLAMLKTQLPTTNWTKRMANGDHHFTIENINESRLVLENLLDDLIAAAEKKSASAVFSSMKRAVLALNKLNKKHEGLIETGEREELVDFITKAVHYTGFETEAEFDLTEEYREW